MVRRGNNRQQNAYASLVFSLNLEFSFLNFVQQRWDSDALRKPKPS